MIKTTVVGSYPMPDWLAAYPSQQALEDATMVVLKTQELAEIDVIADGELYRFDINHPETNGMIEYFVRPLGNVRSEVTRADVAAFGKQKGMGFRVRPAGIVEGSLHEGMLDLVSAYRRIRPLTKAAMKFTVTGPHMLSKTLLDYHYKDLPSLALALAGILAKQISQIDADVVQIDEANLPGSPEEWEWAAHAINVMLDAVPNTPAVHLCFGNYGGQTVQKGSWDKLISYLNALHADHVVLEFAHRGYSELDYFKDLRPEVGIGLGVVDIKSTVIETPELIAERLEHATRVLGENRIRYIHPDCGFWMLKRSIANAKIRSLTLGRNLFEGH
ncbi:MAG TPA: cobalamin-independent methionine synthase II family protein [Cyclobacteriaceae bacterium]|nr:cobalamin-independent methionine synthase II family protein [Cyclobacteriaceae bacterium]